MSSSPEARLSRSVRGRRTARASGDERERAIMQTAERLLQERAIADISVDELARGAGISRPAFYFYFPSKDAVVLALVDRLVEEAGFSKDQVTALLGSDPVAGWRAGIELFYEIFGSHRSLIRAAADLSAINEDARKLWSNIMESWVSDVAEIIEAERKRIAVQPKLPTSPARKRHAVQPDPPTPPARELATALVQLNERALRAIFIDEAPALSEAQAIDTLSHIWLSAIYGTPAPR